MSIRSYVSLYHYFKRLQLSAEESILHKSTHNDGLPFL